MGSAIARNGTFIGGLDLIWTRLGETETINNLSSPYYGAQVNVKLGEDIVTGFGGVRIPVGPPNLELYGTLGTRYFAAHASIALTHPLVPFGASVLQGLQSDRLLARNVSRKFCMTTFSCSLCGEQPPAPHSPRRANAPSYAS